MPTSRRWPAMTAVLLAWAVMACQQTAQPAPPVAPTTTKATKQAASGSSQDSGDSQSSPGQSDATAQVAPQPPPSIGVLGSSLGNGSPTPSTTALPSQTPATTAGTQAAAPAAMDALQTICLNSINQYRLSIGHKPVAWKADSAKCADDQVGLDGAAGTAHKNFGKCSEMAQDECPGWPAPMNVQLPKCLAAMWAEGPGGGHYENMANAAYTKVSCGIAQVGGNFWMVQNFYP